MLINITNDLLGTKTAECNEIIMSNIKMMMMNMKAAMQLLKKRALRIIPDNVNLDHVKCTHLSATVSIVDIIFTDTIKV